MSREESLKIREEFWNSESAEIIMDLLIDATIRSEIMGFLNTIDPDYARLLPTAKKEFAAAYDTSSARSGE